LRQDSLHVEAQAHAESSRPPRTGSIAAQRPPARLTAVVRAGRPVRQGRAPLRHISPLHNMDTGETSSRPPRTGSIAASLPLRDDLRGSLVVPSAKDGLHCGRADGDGALVYETGRPVRQGRAPLRQSQQQHQGGELPGRPVRQGRAPLRRVPSIRAPTGRYRSSRPPRTGSIAAARSPSRPRPLRRSSRPPRTGSIAATTRQAAWWGRCPVVPSAKDGLHCGADQLNTLVAEAEVVPSAKDGLHCGMALRSHVASSATSSSRPPRTGSIAARHATPTRRTGRRVVPSAKDGLHCGARAAVGRYSLVKSSRPPRTGSIAAMDFGLWGCNTKPVVPSAKDGLHCGSAAAMWGAK